MAYPTIGINQLVSLRSLLTICTMDCDYGSAIDNLVLNYNGNVTFTVDGIGDDGARHDYTMNSEGDVIETITITVTRDALRDRAERTFLPHYPDENENFDPPECE